MTQSFRKSERLIRKSLISLLFRKGDSWFEFPYKITWMFVSAPMTDPVQVLFTVPRWLFRKSVDRNLIRRRMREEYRRNKEILYDSLHRTGRQMILCYRYSSGDILPSSVIREKIIVTLMRLKDLNEKAGG